MNGTEITTKSRSNDRVIIARDSDSIYVIVGKDYFLRYNLGEFSDGFSDRIKQMSEENIAKMAKDIIKSIIVCHRFSDGCSRILVPERGDLYSTSAMQLEFLRVININNC